MASDIIRVHIVLASLSTQIVGHTAARGDTAVDWGASFPALPLAHLGMGPQRCQLLASGLNLLNDRIGAQSGRRLTTSVRVSDAGHRWRGHVAWAGVGKPPGNEPAGRLADGTPQALWRFRHCLRHGNALLTSLSKKRPRMTGVIWLPESVGARPDRASAALIGAFSPRSGKRRRCRLTTSDAGGRHFRWGWMRRRS